MCVPRRRVLAVLVVGTVAACAHAPAEGGRARQTLRMSAGGATFLVSYLPEDGAAALSLARALPSRRPARGQRWGALRAPVSITVHPSHDSLERATGLSDHPWLRGWATFDAVEVQSPRTWWALGAARPRWRTSSRTS